MASEAKFHVSLETIGVNQNKWVFTSLMNRVGRVGDPKGPDTSECILLHTALLLFHHPSHVQFQHQRMNIYGVLYFEVIGEFPKVSMDWCYRDEIDRNPARTTLHRVPRVNLHIGDEDGEYAILHLTSFESNQSTS